MTLIRQLTLIILALFGAVSCGTLVISINNTRQYLNDQLASHAQDTATSLALSLSPHLEAGDAAVIESMIDAIFDRGFYREIVLRPLGGGKAVERRAPLQIAGVPAWFVGAVPLETPQGEALVMAGWNQTGTLAVMSHPGYAYAELWRTAVSTLRWIGACMVLAMVLGAVLLRLLLRPLKSVEQQAEAICNRSYPIQQRIPRTRELKQVVLAMNRMASRVRQMFEEQSTVTEGLRTQLYADQVSGLGNRRYFDAQLEQVLLPRSDSGTPALLLLELDDFKEYNDREGYAAGDRLIREAAVMVRESAADNLTARVSGATFALLMSRASAEDAADLAIRLCSGLERIRTAGFPVGASAGHVGVALARPGADAAELLANADQALRSAQLIGPNHWQLRDAGIPPGHPKGAQQWREFLDRALAENRFTLHFQPVLSLAAAPAILHQEALMRVCAESGETLPAAAFLPMAERVGLGRALDRAGVELVLSHLRSHRESTLCYAVNLAPPSLADREFLDWLGAALHQAPEAAARLIFETSEYGAVTNLDNVRDFLRRITPLGSRFSLDHFGRGFASFGYLNSLPVDYLKIDGCYIRQIESSRDNQFFVHALTRAAHDLEIKVIAETVESSDERDTLIRLKVDGIQGYLSGRPSAATEPSGPTP